FPEPHKSSTKQQNLFLYRKQNLAISFSSIPRMVLQMKSHMWGLLWVKTKCIMQAIRLVMPIQQQIIGKIILSVQGVAKTKERLESYETPYQQKRKASTTKHIKKVKSKNSSDAKKDANNRKD